MDARHAATAVGPAKALEAGSLLKAQLDKHLLDVLTLQEERVLAWREFDVSFKEYLLDAPAFDAAKLQRICRHAAQKMNSISERILGIKLKLSAEVYDATKLHAQVEELQSCAARKFQLVNPIITTVLSGPRMSLMYRGEGLELP